MVECSVHVEQDMRWESTHAEKAESVCVNLVPSQAEHT